MVNLGWLLDKTVGFWNIEKDSNNYKALTMIASHYDDQDKALGEVYRLWHIDTAYGQGLDDLGQDEGLSRQGMTDETYRNLLNVKRYVDMSNGTNEDINVILKAFMGDDFLRVEEGWNSFLEEPASMVVNVSRFADNIPFNFIRTIKPAGVRVSFVAGGEVSTITLRSRSYSLPVYFPITNMFKTANVSGGISKTLITLRERAYNLTVMYPITNDFTPLGNDYLIKGALGLVESTAIYKTNFAYIGEFNVGESEYKKNHIYMGEFSVGEENI